MYYCLIAGLPDLHVTDTKLRLDLGDYLLELKESLNETDLALVNWVLMGYDNVNLLQLLAYEQKEFSPYACLNADELQELVANIKQGEHIVDKIIPTYFTEFIQWYFAENKEETALSNEDKLNSMYYAAAMAKKNAFLSAWFEMNLNINNVLAAQAARKYNWQVSSVLINGNELAEQLRTSNAKDFGIGEMDTYLKKAIALEEESDLFVREQKLLQIKWEWLEEHIFFQYFTIEKVLAYLLQVQLLERMLKLDAVEGKAKFDSLISALK